MALRKLYSSKSAIFNAFNCKSARNFSASSKLYDNVVTQSEKISPKISDWDRALDEAVKCVGYQTPYLTLRYLTNDDNLQWMKHMQKLEDTEHPMKETAKELFAQGKANVNQVWGLVVLLVSKLAGYPADFPFKEVEFDKDTGILKDQRVLAESVEITSTANEIHRDGILNMQHYNLNGMSLDNDNLLVFGNKMAILGGDILLGFASTQFAKLKAYQANILLTTAARDVSDSNFLGERDNQNFPLPSDPFKKFEEQRKNQELFDEVSTDQIDNTLPFKLHDVMGTAEQEWRLRHTLIGGTLLGKSCQAAMILAKHNDEIQREVYFMGKHMYLGYRAARDLQTFKSKKLPPSGKFSLISAPVLFHLEHEPELYDEIKKGLETIDQVDYEKIHKIVRNGPGIEQTKELLNKNNLIAFTLLHKFPKNDSRQAIENLILALEH